MTIANDIRELAGRGTPVTEIARKLGIRYQHAYHVLNRSGLLPEKAGRAVLMRKVIVPTMPDLAVDELLRCGFAESGEWTLSTEGMPFVDRPLPKDVGVYVFAKQGKAIYVGVALMGIARRVHFYERPGKTQRTSRRIHELLKTELHNGIQIQIFTASPPDFDWNGLPVHGSGGLEIALISKYAPTWNIRGARRLKP